MNPFTVVVCTACAADGGTATLDALRATVRRCPHGVLITTDCPRGHRGCAGSGADEVTVVVQPCGVDRAPVGSARRLGPFGAADVRAVCQWLERGDWDAPVSLWWNTRGHVGSRN